MTDNIVSNERIRCENCLEDAIVVLQSNREDSDGGVLTKVLCARHAEYFKKTWNDSIYYFHEYPIQSKEKSV